MRKGIFLFLFCWVATFTQAQVNSVLDADLPLEYDTQKQELVARKNAELVYGDCRTQADEIRFNQEKKVLEARGNVKINYRTLFFISPAASLEVVTKELAAQKFHLSNGTQFIRGRSIAGNLDELKIQNPTIYFNEPDAASYNLKAEKATVLEGNKIKMEKVWMRIGRLPFLYLPGLTYDNEHKSPIHHQSEIFGYSTKLGYFTRNIISSRFDPRWSIGTTFDFYSKRGIFGGPIFKYNLDQAKGSIAFAGISDKGIKGVDALGKAIKRRRKALEFKHQQAITERIDLRSQAIYHSDSEVIKDFKPLHYRDENNPDNFTEVVYRGDDFLVSAFSRYRLNRFQGVNEKLPELRFDAMPRALSSSPLYHQGNLSFANLRRTTIRAPRVSSKRVDAYYGLSWPIQIKEGISFVPVAGTRVTHYEEGPYTRFLGQVGFDTRFTLNRVWDYKNEKWEIDQLRHVFQPVIQYRYVPDAQKGKGKIPQVETDYFSYGRTSLDLADQRNVDDLHETHTIRLGIENFLETKAKEFGSRTLSAFHVYQDFRFSPKSGQNRLSDTYFDFSLTPIECFTLDTYLRVNPKKGKVQEWRQQLTIINGSRWKVSCGVNFFKKVLNQLRLKADYHLDSRHTITAGWVYDWNKRKLLRQDYGLSMIAGNSWRIIYALELRSDTKSFQDRTNCAFKVMFEMISLGQSFYFDPVKRRIR